MRKYEYYDTPDDGDYDGYGGNWMAQTFTSGTIHLLAKVKLKFFRVGDPGTIIVSIKNTTAGKPSGADLCKGTIEGTDITVVESGEWYEITLGSGYTVTAGAQYAIVVRAPGGAADKKVSWRADVAESIYPGGTYCSSSDSGLDWGTISASDCMFEEWGVGEPSPTAVVWGSLVKSQIDAGLIEEAITRMISEHNEDETSHLGTGQSLQSHKASEIIDHVVASIIADKIKNFAVTSEKIGCILFSTWFESVDGYFPQGDVSFFEGSLRIRTAASAYSTGSIQKGLPLNLPGLSWDKHRIVEFSFVPNTNTNQVGLLYCGGGGVWRHIGLKFINATLYATVANGASETAVEITGITFLERHLCRINFFPGEKVDFYLDGVLKTTITTNLPSGITHSNIPMIVYLETQEAVVKTLFMGHWDFKQDV